MCNVDEIDPVMIMIMIGMYLVTDLHLGFITVHGLYHILHGGSYSKELTDKSVKPNP